MGFFDFLKKKQIFDGEGAPIRQVVMEEKDMIYAPCPGTVASLDDAPLTGAVSDEAAGIVVRPSAGVLFAPLTGDVTLRPECNEIAIENFLDVQLLVRVLPLEKPAAGVAKVTEVADAEEAEAAEAAEAVEAEAAEAAPEQASEPAPEKVELKLLVESGAHVHVGDPLATFELADLGKDASVVVLVENADDFAGVQPASEAEIEALDPLLVVLRK